MSVLGQQLPTRRWRSNSSGGSARRRGIRLVTFIAVIAIVVYAGVRYFGNSEHETISDAYSLFLATGLEQNVRIDVANGKLFVEVIRAGSTDVKPVRGISFEMTMGVEEMKRVIDAMGGILINIPETIEYRGPDGLPVRIDAGMRRLDADRVESYLKRPNSSTAASLRAIVLGVTSRAAEMKASGVNPSRLLEAAMDDAAKGKDGRNAERLAGLLAACSHLGPTEIVVEGPGALNSSGRVASLTPTLLSGAPNSGAATEETLATSASSSSAPPTAIRPLKVRILNGVGRPGLAARAALKLPAPRYQVIETANADRFGYAGTLVLSTSEALAQEVIGALGIGRYEARPASGGADVDVILGADMRQM